MFNYLNDRHWIARTFQRLLCTEPVLLFIFQDRFEDETHSEAIETLPASIANTSSLAAAMCDPLSLSLYSQQCLYERQSSVGIQTSLTMPAREEERNPASRFFHASHVPSLSCSYRSVVTRNRGFLPLDEANTK